MKYCHHDDGLCRILTPKEAEVAGYVYAGYSNGGIAIALAIHRRTVEFHLRHIYEKLMLSNLQLLNRRIVVGLWYQEHFSDA